MGHYSHIGPGRGNEVPSIIDRKVPSQRCATWAHHAKDQKPRSPVLVYKAVESARVGDISDSSRSRTIDYIAYAIGVSVHSFGGMYPDPLNVVVSSRLSLDEF
jgi:hypothetical protein